MSDSGLMSLGVCTCHQIVFLGLNRRGKVDLVAFFCLVYFSLCCVDMLDFALFLLCWSRYTALLFVHTFSGILVQLLASLLVKLN